MRLTRHIIALSVIGVLPVNAQVRTSERIASVEAGVFCAADTEIARDAPGTIADETHVIVAPIPFAAEGPTVPAVIGIGFGISALATDPAGTGTIEIVVKHPPLGEGGVRTQFFLSEISGEGPSQVFFQFDHDYELVPGTWTITAQDGREILYQQRFEVVDPAEAPLLSQLCNHVDHLS